MAISHYRNNNPALNTNSNSTLSDASTGTGVAPGKKGEEPIRVDGYAQVLAMLQAADPAFRDSLLRRIAQRDLQLARSLLASLRQN